MTHRGANLSLVTYSDGTQRVLKATQIKGPDPELVFGAKTEIELLAQLAHPGIIPCQDAFIRAELNEIALLLPYCEGGDLRVWLEGRNGVHLSEADVLFFFVQIALSLEYVHFHNILHRDLKPANLLLSKGLCYLADFGVATVLETSSLHTDAGTPQYMSPELVRNEGYSWPSDVWALGCVLYELIDLTPTFTGFLFSVAYDALCCFIG